eukprot:CAMPEP_0206136680 /NCGR_PEP_ID=MMETSP1473-20131121/1924_1 /ASSEMBLY_ACC=CAM_ASM_001109 /TAXON_ID=1461547 /ORGANISM="Stichococcus sp, Strain RCC1054" /LENGTH=155 /DNA_ID=CAMNT_0053529397 /DNA_START=136 /DNA_END=603 /DNA_ORIENTATION=+
MTSLSSSTAFSGRTMQYTSRPCRAARPLTQQIVGAQSLLGRVISAKSDKTIIIAYESFKEHKLYRKRMKNTSRIPAHDEEGLASTGDYVQIVPCRPISKSKRFKLGRIINKFELEVDDQTGEVAVLGNYVEDPEASADVTDSQAEALGVPSEQLA